MRRRWYPAARARSEVSAIHSAQLRSWTRPHHRLHQPRAFMKRPLLRQILRSSRSRLARSGVYRTAHSRGVMPSIGVNASYGSSSRRPLRRATGGLKASRGRCTVQPQFMYYRHDRRIDRSSPYGDSDRDGILNVPTAIRATMRARLTPLAPGTTRTRDGVHLTATTARPTTRTATDGYSPGPALASPAGPGAPRVGSTPALWMAIPRCPSSNAICCIYCGHQPV